LLTLLEIDRCLPLWFTWSSQNGRINKERLSPALVLLPYKALFPFSFVDAGIGPSLLRVLPPLPLPWKAKSTVIQLTQPRTACNVPFFFARAPAPRSVFLIFILGSLCFLFLGDPAFKLKWGAVGRRYGWIEIEHVGDQFRLEDSCLFVFGCLCPRAITDYDYDYRLSIILPRVPAPPPPPPSSPGKFLIAPLQASQDQAWGKSGCRSPAPLFSALFINHETQGIPDGVWRHQQQS